MIYISFINIPLCRPLSLFASVLCIRSQAHIKPIETSLEIRRLKWFGHWLRLENIYICAKSLKLDPPRPGHHTTVSGPTVVSRPQTGAVAAGTGCHRPSLECSWGWQPSSAMTSSLTPTNDMVVNKERPSTKHIHKRTQDLYLLKIVKKLL